MTTLGAQPRRHAFGRAATAALVVVAALLMPSAAARAASEWPVWRHDSARTGFNAEETELQPPLELLWSRDDAVELDLAAADGLVFASVGGRLQAFAGRDGRLRWSDSQDRQPSRSPAVRNGRVFLLDHYSGGDVWALEQSTGALLWTREGVGYGTLAFADGAVTDGYYGFSEDIGETLWQLPTECTDRGSEPYALAGTTVYGFGQGTVTRPPLQACEIGAGEVKWGLDLPLAGRPAGFPTVANSRVFAPWNVNSDTALVYSVDAETGEDLRSFEVLAEIGSSLAVAYGRVYVGAEDAIIRALDAESLAPLWKQPLNGPINSSPAVANGVVYVTTRADDGGRLYALDAATGAVIWWYDIPGSDDVSAVSPIVADGRLYLVGSDCRRCTLYAFASQRAEPPPVSEPPPTVEETSVPELGRSVVVAPVRGTVLVQVVGEEEFVEITGPLRIPVGSEVDARRGEVEVTSVRDEDGGLQSGTFRDGLFRVLQSQEAPTVTELRLEGGDFDRCAEVAPETSIRRLWGEAEGRFRTRGRYSSTTVRGTVWLTEDRCAGTRTFVREGSVEVEDLERGRVAVLEAGRDYLATPAARSRLWLIVGLAGGGLLGVGFLGTAGVLWRRRNGAVGGALSARVCTRCGAAARPASRFCGACGSELRR